MSDRRRAAAWQARGNQAMGRTARLSLSDEIDTLLADPDFAPSAAELPEGFHRLPVASVERLSEETEENGQ